MPAGLRAHQANINIDGFVRIVDKSHPGGTARGKRANNLPRQVSDSR